MPCELLLTEDHSENEYAEHEGGGDRPLGCAQGQRRSVQVNSPDFDAGDDPLFRPGGRAGHADGGHDDLGGSPPSGGRAPPVPSSRLLAPGYRRRRTIWAMSSRLHPRARASAV